MRRCFCRRERWQMQQTAKGPPLFTTQVKTALGGGGREERGRGKGCAVFVLGWREGLVSVECVAVL